MPWAKIPTIALADGTTIAQTKAMLRLIGKTSGTYPLDPMLAFRADELIDTVEDLSNATRLTGEKLEGAEKEAARKASAEAGDIADGLRRLNEFIGKHGANGFAVGNSLTIADFAVFSTCSNMIANYDGVPITALDPFPNIQAVRKTVASLPSTVGWYASRGDAKSKSELLNASAKDL
jgi:glutathione S-transferase